MTNLAVIKTHIVENDGVGRNRKITVESGGVGRTRKITVENDGVVNS